MSKATPVLVLLVLLGADSSLSKSVRRSKRALVEKCIYLSDVVLSDGVPWTANYNEHIKFNAPVQMNNWRVSLVFNRAVNTLTGWNFNVNGPAADKQTFTLTPLSWNAQLQGFQDWSYIIEFPVFGAWNDHPVIVFFELRGLVDASSSGYSTCQTSGTSATTTTAATTTATTTTTKAATTTASTTATTTKATTTTTTTATTTTKATTTTTTAATTQGSECNFKINNAWDGGYNGIVTIPVPLNSNGWLVRLVYDSLASSAFEMWLCNGVTKGPTTYECYNKDWNPVFYASPFNLDFNLRWTAPARPVLQQVVFTSGSYVYSCVVSGVTLTSTAATTTPTSQTTTTSSPTTASTTSSSSAVPTTVATPPSSCVLKYNYADVIARSLLFYKAQRSGYLPASNNIPWRYNSCVNDGADNNINLSGGYYDAGDGLKLGFPLAFSLTLLSWGMISSGSAYGASYRDGLDAIRWGMDYLIKCHPSDNVFYGQVGDEGADHSYPGRIEDFTGYRPSVRLDTTRPGTDLAAESAAAFAAAAVAFRTADPAYSATLVSHARSLFNFANTYRGKYSSQSGFCCYSSYDEGDDELAWAAAWLYWATNERLYLDASKNIYSSKGIGSRPSEFSWGDKKAGVQVLLAKLDGGSQYVSDVQTFTRWVRNVATRTPKGLVWLQPWGSNRHAANVALIAMAAANIGIDANENINFARQQINYMLGDSGRSYVVGFGNNPPKRPHHKNSACKDGCKSWAEFSANTDNYYTLHGALVGGPGQNDDFVDDRTDYVKNEVALDYNAGFQGAVAALLKNDCPS